MDEPDADQSAGEVPAGVGPELFRDRLRQAAGDDAAGDAYMQIEERVVYLEDIESVEAEGDGHRSRVRLRSGLIIGGITGAAIVTALATVRYRRRHR